MKSIRFIALISAAAMCFGLCACGKSEKKDEIAVPILETKDITYKTVKAEIGDISQEYHQEGVYDYPYSETVTFKASGQIKSIDVESPCDVKKGDLLCTLYSDDVDEQIEEEENLVKNVQGISEIIKINLQSIDITSIENTQNIQLIVPEDTEKFENFVYLKSRTKKNEFYTLNTDGVIITEKLAKLLNINVGDIIKIKNNDDIEVETKVSHITENYLMHYIYMSKDLYESLYNEEFRANTIYANINDLSRENEIGEEILHANDLITGIVLTSSTENIFSEVMENMNFVVWILIISAGLLAFVVLYNLANTNISERIRELATIKVLGFYDREVYDYISKETRILTAIGMILGLFAGYFLTMFIIKTCELDLMMFSRSINSISFVYALIITVVFSVIVEIATYFALKKIDMIESLKSIE